MQTEQLTITEWQERVGVNLATLGYPDAPYWKQALLVAVSKYVPAEAIEGAFHAGIQCFGESKAVEALKKREQLDPDINEAIEWHFIGSIQSNKLNKIVGHYDLIHSVDRLSLIEAIAEKADAQGIKQSILLQVNVSGEESKSGFSPDDLRQAVEATLKYDNSLQLLGFMTLAPLTTDMTVIDASFGGLRCLRDAMESLAKTRLPHLSMGMSSDYGHALANGATIVRIGSKLFT